MTAKKDRLFKDVDFMTKIRPYRNYRNIESLKKASNYIKKEFKKAGLKLEEQEWDVKDKNYINVIASYDKENPMRLIVGAHYDVEGDKPGADDNASGIAGLLETARLVMENKPELDFGIDFVAYCLEEPPYFSTDKMGSYIHARSLFEKKTKVVGMFCYEMIGFFSDEPGSQKYPVKLLESMYPDKANFILVVGVEKYKDFSEKFCKLMAKDSKIDVRSITLPMDIDLARMSDHSNYWTFGYKALMITDTAQYRNKNYHMPTDTVDTLNFDKMAEVVNSTYHAITKLI